MDERNAFSELALRDSIRKAIDIVTREIEKDAAGLVFFFGPSGIGKTQLLRIILSKINAETKVLLYETESIDDELLSALKQNNLGQVKDSYKNSDLLILENFDAICLGNVIGNCFADIFEHYIDNKKNVILTSSFSPDIDAFQSQRLKEVLSQFLFIDLSAEKDDVKMGENDER